MDANLLLQASNELLERFDHDFGGFGSAPKFPNESQLGVLADLLTNQFDQEVENAFILSLEAKYEILLLDKINVCYKQGEFVQYKDLKEFKKMMKNKATTMTTVSRRGRQWWWG